MKHRLARTLSLAAALLLLGTGAALAQDTSIAGVVTDATGGVLPGVTVEVASPALIEGVRTVVTDGTGRYSVTQLRPGTYSVTFTLSGFAVVRREGVVLTTGFSAPVNAEMKVGSLEETVTVTGASPTVDVQNVRTQNTLARETLDTLPNAQTLSSIASLTLGVKVTAIVQQDVGGNQGEMGAVSVHNARTVDQKISMEGMNTNNSMGTNGGVFHAGQHYNMEAFQEVTLAHTGMGADTETAGAQINYVPKDGGNKFSGSARATYVNDDWQSDNLTDALKARGATTPPKIKRVYDGGGAVGGPIKRDKLWFYTAHRWWGDQTYQPGTFYNATQGTPVYTADLNRPGYLENYNKDNSIRLTWQASGADKIALYQNFGNQCVCYLGVSSTFAPEAAGHNGTPENRLTQVTWNRVQTNKLLFEGGFTYLHNPFAFNHEDRPGVAPGTGRQGVGYDAIPMIELAPFRIFNARIPGFLPYTDCQGPAPACGLSPAGQQNGRFSVSYVTGSHSFKAGFTAAHGRVDVNGQGNAVPGFGPAYFTLLFGRPIAVTLAAQPNYARSDFRNMGFYVQDQWSIRNLTLNIGGRFDMFDGWSPDQTYPGGAFVPSFSITRIEKTPTWRDFSPRFGAAYDVAGDGKTALKFSAGRYVGAAGAGTVQPTNPINAIVSSATRPWFDANGDFFPDANELGPLDNAAFGTVVQNTLFDPDYLTKNRAYTWQISGGVERELTGNVGVSVNYFRTMHFNQTVTDNTLVTPADFDTFSVVVPAGLPNAGQTVSGLATPSLATFGKVKNLVRSEKTFGNQTEMYDGVDVALRTRFDNGAILQGGISVGKTVDDHCFVVDSPQDLHFCKVQTPWWDGNGQIKLAGSYPIPGGVELSAVYQNLPGLPISANVQYTNADIRPSLGRNLPTATVTIPLLEPNTVFEERINQVDVRAAKVFRGSFGRIRVSIDLYNAFNSSTILTRNNTFVAASGGAGWGNPTRILGGRLIKWYAQYYF